MRNYVCSTFRENRWLARRREPLRELHLHRRFRKLLSLLNRANDGYLKPLERVILLAYGRIGKRRWMLLEPLLPTSVQIYNDDWKAPSDLIALLKSQSRQRVVANMKIHRPIKHLEPPYPKENIWGKPIAYVRRVNIRKRWYRSLVQTALPVLPEQEWELVQSLATGKLPWALPKRRKAPTQPQQETLLTPEFIIHGPQRGPTFSPYVKGRPHNITRKLMEGIWKTVCELTPKMTWVETKKTWTFAWGIANAPQRQSSRKLDPEKGLSLFEGIDAKSGMIVTAKPQKLKRVKQASV